MGSNSIISSWVDFAAYNLLDFQIELFITLVIDFSKLNTGRQIGSWGCTFDQKGFSQ